MVGCNGEVRLINRQSKRSPLLPSGFQILKSHRNTGRVQSLSIRSEIESSTDRSGYDRTFPGKRGLFDARSVGPERNSPPRNRTSVRCRVDALGWQTMRFDTGNLDPKTTAWTFPVSLQIHASACTTKSANRCKPESKKRKTKNTQSCTNSAPPTRSRIVDSECVPDRFASFATARTKIARRN